MSLPFIDLSNPFSSYPWNCQAPPSGIPSPLAVRQNLPSPAPSGPKFSENVFTAAPVSRFIFTPSNRFGLLVALTSKPPSENELAEVSYVCSQPSCHPTELQSYSTHQNSSRRSIRHHSNHRSRKCQWYRHVPIPEFLNLSLISIFQALRDQFSMFCPCANLCHLWFLWTILWISPCFLYSCLLPSLLDHDVLCVPLPEDCLPVLLRALQSR